MDLSRASRMRLQPMPMNAWGPVGSAGRRPALQSSLLTTPPRSRSENGEACSAASPLGISPGAARQAAPALLTPCFESISAQPMLQPPSRPVSKSIAEARVEAVKVLKNGFGAGERPQDVAAKDPLEEEGVALPSVAELLGQLDVEELEENCDVEMMFKEHDSCEATESVSSSSSCAAPLGEGRASGSQLHGRLQFPKGWDGLVSKASSELKSVDIPMLHLRINGLNGPLGDVFADMHWDLAQLAYEVQQVLGVPPIEQRLFFEGEELSGFAVLARTLFRSEAAAQAAIDAGTVTELALVRRPHEQALWRDWVQKDWLKFRDAPEHIRSDHDVALAAVERNWIAIEDVLDNPWDNKRLVYAAVKQNWELIEQASETVRGDRETVLAAVEQNDAALAYASELLRGDSDVVMIAVEQNWNALEFATEGPRDDTDVVMLAVMQDWRALEYASDRLRNDESIIRAAMRQDSDALELAGPEIKGCHEIALQAVLRNGFALEHVAPELKADREVVLAAVRQEGCAIRHAAKELQSDYEVFETAIKQNWLALKYAGAEARADLGILKAAMQKDVRAYQYACEEAWSSKEFVLEVVRQTQDCSLLRYASEDLRADGTLLCAAARVDPTAINYAIGAAWSRRDFVLAAVRFKGDLLQQASDELRADRMVVLEAAEKDMKALEFASELLWADEEFVFEVVQLQGLLIQRAAPELRELRDVVLAAVMQDGSALHHVPKHFQEDHQMILAAARAGDVKAFRYAPSEAWADRDFVLTAVQVSGFMLHHATKELRSDPEIMQAAALCDKRKSVGPGLARGLPPRSTQLTLLQKAAENAKSRN